MNLKDFIDLATGILAFLFLLIGGVAGIFLFFQLAPVLTLRIIPTWIDISKDLLTLRFEVENKSRVRVSNPKIRIQVLEHKIPESGTLSQWVPFAKTAIKSIEPPVEWHEPEEIGSTTQRIFPGETIAIERLYHFPQTPLILHVALQVQIRLGWFDRLVTRKGQSWSQTTTCFVIKGSQNPSAS